MPVLAATLGALPARFRRQRVLVVGCGDIGLRVAQIMRPRVLLRALTSSPRRVDELRSRGITPLPGNLDRPHSIRHLAGIAKRVIYLAPPPDTGGTDPRVVNLLRALRLRSLPISMVYASTSGVYGDCHGELVFETRPTAAGTERAARRVDAERSMRALGRATALRCAILRIPGIYANDRVGGTPRARLQKGMPVLQTTDDVYSNHIHADDLARACVVALWRGRPQRVYHVVDDSCLKMGDYFDLAADLYGLARPARITRAQAQHQLPPMLLSFMSESRRMDNTRLKRELRLPLRYPTVNVGLR